MKQSFVLIILLSFTINLCFSQSNQLSIGVEAAYHLEQLTRTLETILNEGKEVHSNTDFWGVGIVLQKKFANSWGFSTGLNYVKRQYNTKVFFDHCYFGTPCELDLRTVGNYGYKTIETPFGISKYLSAGNKWEFYIKFNLLTAIDFQSYYYKGKSYSKN